MRLARLTLLGSLILAACLEGRGSGLTGVAGSGGGGGAAAQRTLSFVVHPAGANSGEILTPAIQVAALDTLGATDVTFAANVTVRFGGNPTGAFLRGTLTVAAVNGVARFGDLTVDRPGSGFTLVATAPGVRAATSAAFNIVTPP